jgi:hypothetical protein
MSMFILDDDRGSLAAFSRKIRFLTRVKLGFNARRAATSSSFLVLVFDFESTEIERELFKLIRISIRPILLHTGHIGYLIQPA